MPLANPPLHPSLNPSLRPSLAPSPNPSENASERVGLCLVGALLAGGLLLAACAVPDGRDASGGAGPERRGPAASSGVRGDPGGLGP
ncbi:hypothetical protein [Streptomyces sp. NPDC047014]|uniref:hypothetical protein n=1 Tax=Streptomyces sp. NPDC047014 TaxID=3155736 RepID=UPI0033C98967